MRGLLRGCGILPILTIFLPFAAGYHISYLFRTVNAIIAPNLVEELGVDAKFLGLITSVYFLSFAIVQLPLGVFLDKFGARRVQAPLMLVAGIGALLFALGQYPFQLLLGRALIGFGVAGALMSGLKALAEQFPKERLTSLNGWFIMIGTTGSIMATLPSAAVLDAIGWRGLFVALAAMSIAVGIAIFLVAPEFGCNPGEKHHRSIGAPGLWKIYTDRRFLQLAPLSAACISTAWAVQGLWAARWLADVENLNGQEIAADLLVMACALSLGAGALGTLADRLRREDVSLTATFGLAALAFVLVETAIIMRLPAPAYVLWAMVAVFGAMTVLSYAMLGEFFPKESVGRANAALNVLHIGGAFVLQSAIGFVVAWWAADPTGRYPDIAYQTGLAIPVVLQIVALLWFIRGIAIPRLEIQSPTITTASVLRQIPLPKRGPE